MKKISIIVMIFFLLSSVSVFADNQDTFDISLTVNVNYPSSWDCTETPTSPAVYTPVACYRVECKWNGATIITQVITEFDGQNYTTDELGNYRWSFRICDLPIGNHTWKQYGQNIGGFWNVTDLRTYTVQSPCAEGDSSCNALFQSGIGMGSFLGSITNPTFMILMTIASISLVMTLVYAIATFMTGKGSSGGAGNYQEPLQGGEEYQNEL